MPSPISNKPQSVPESTQRAPLEESPAFVRYKKAREGYSSFCDSRLAKTASPICSNNTGGVGATFATTKTLTGLAVIILLASTSSDSKKVKPNIADVAIAAELNRLTTNSEGQPVVGALQSPQSAFNPNLAVAAPTGLPSGTLGNFYLAQRYSEYKAAQKVEHNHAKHLESVVVFYVLAVLLDVAAAKLLNKPAAEPAPHQFYLNISPGIDVGNSGLGGTNRTFTVGWQFQF